MSTSKRKTLAVVAAVAAFAAVSASAATLGGITSGSLGADTKVVASCDTVGGVSVTYANSYDSATKEYVVDGVTVAGIDAACDTGSIKVALANGATKLGEITGTISGTSWSGNLSSPVSAKNVNDVAVVIVK